MWKSAKWITITRTNIAYTKKLPVKKIGPMIGMSDRIGIDDRVEARRRVEVRVLRQDARRQEARDAQRRRC